MKRNTLNTFITATLIMLLGVSSSASAQTIVPMGNLMGKTSVTFGEGDAAETYSSALKIDFVPKAPDLSEIAPQTLEDAKSATATFSITSRANGPADYTLASEVARTNLADGGLVVTFDQTDNIVNLGATAVVKVNEDRSLSVPSDGAVDAEVNGIKATDKVMIDGVRYTVEAVADDGVTATIRLQGGLGDANPSMGTPIWEQQEVEVTLAGIGVAEVEGPSKVTVTVKASIGGLIGDTTFIATRTVEVLPWARTYVRNTTDEEKNPTDEVAADLPEENAFEVDGTWYFSSLAGAESEEGLAEDDYNEAAQVKAAAGDTLEYVIVASAGNTLDKQRFSIEETFPPFTVEGSAAVEEEFIRLLGPGLRSVAARHADMCAVELCWVGGLVRNQVAHIRYTLQLGEAEEVESKDSGMPPVAVDRVTATPPYTGCLIPLPDRVTEQCVPDGTPWTVLLACNDNYENQTCGGCVGKGCDDVTQQYTACWGRLPSQVFGEWVVGANGVDSSKQSTQDEIREEAAVYGGYGVPVAVKEGLLPALCTW